MYKSNSELSDLVINRFHSNITKDDFINNFDLGINQKMNKSIDCCYDINKNSKVLYGFFENSYDHFARSIVCSNVVPEQLKKETRDLLLKSVKQDIIQNYICNNINLKQEPEEISARGFRLFLNMTLNNIRKYNIPIFKETSFFYNWNRERDYNEEDNNGEDIINYGFDDICNDIWYKTFPNLKRIKSGNKKAIYEFLFYVFAYKNFELFVSIEDIKDGKEKCINKKCDNEYELVRGLLLPVNNKKDMIYSHEMVISRIFCQLIYLKQHCHDNKIDVGFAFELNPEIIKLNIYGYSEDWSTRKKAGEILIISEAIEKDSIKKYFDQSIRQDKFFIKIIDDLINKSKVEESVKKIIDILIKSIVNEILGEDLISIIYKLIRNQITFSKDIGKLLRNSFIININDDNTIKSLRKFIQNKIHKNKEYRKLGKNLLGSRAYLDFYKNYPSDEVLKGILKNIITSITDLYRLKEYKGSSKEKKDRLKTNWDKEYCEGLNNEIILQQHKGMEYEITLVYIVIMKMFSNMMWDSIFKEYDKTDDIQIEYNWKNVCKKMIKWENNRTQIDSSILKFIMEQDLK